MTLADIGQAIADNPLWVAILAVIIPSIIEITPIRWNPWTKLAKWIGRAINGDVLKELDGVKKSQAEIAKRLDDRVKVEDERNADNQRERILEFNVELMRNLKHTREDFIEILRVIDDYEHYCTEHPDYQNNRATHAVRNIERVYDERLRKNDFFKADAE